MQVWRISENVWRIKALALNSAIESFAPARNLAHLQQIRRIWAFAPNSGFGRN
jgi:hypothetical protein